MAKVTKEEKEQKVQSDIDQDSQKEETSETTEATEKAKEVVEEEQAAAEDNEKKPEEKPGKTKELEQISIELAEQKDKFLRMYSEFENFRRRTAKEKVELMGTASEKLMLELLPILDDFERAEKSFGEAEKGDVVREGFVIIQNKLKKTLEKQGLKEMESPVGKDFDTELHEAVTQFPAPEEKLKGKVIDQLEKGYYLNQKVIRYAKVVVGS